MESFNFKRDVPGTTIKQLADEQPGRRALVKVNTEEYPEVAQQHSVMSTPSPKLTAGNSTRSSTDKNHEKRGLLSSPPPSGTRILAVTTDLSNL